MTRSTLALLALFIGAVFAPASFAQREYASETGSWKFTCPDSWSPIGFAIIKHEEEQAKAEWPDKNFKYIAGFTKGGMNTFVLPYVLINKTEVDLSGASLADLELGLQVKQPKYERELALQTLVSSFIMGDTTLDRSRLRTVSVTEGANEKGEQLRCTTYSYLGKSFIIQFECYDLASRGDANLAAFGEVVNSFSFRDDSKFVPVPEGEKSQYDPSNYSTKPLNAKSERRSSSGSGYRSYRIYGLGGVIALIVGAILKIVIRD